MNVIDIILFGALAVLGALGIVLFAWAAGYQGRIRYRADRHE